MRRFRLLIISVVFFIFTGFVYGVPGRKIHSELNATTWVLIASIATSETCQIKVKSSLNTNLMISQVMNTGDTKSEIDSWFANVYETITVWHRTPGISKTYYFYGKYRSGAVATTGEVYVSYQRRI